MLDRQDPFEMRMADTTKQQVGRIAFANVAQANQEDTWALRAMQNNQTVVSDRLSSAVGGVAVPRAFRQELDELVRSIVIDRNRSTALPAFEMACKALGYEYDAKEQTLYRNEVHTVHEQRRVKVL